ncbi:HNH endonuclease domain-containing protein [Pedobacter sp. UYP1]|uniref:HNH endonuclease domain-containing protein n=1 Tax=Pedobacter sp. UYP1 TaxID=1756396 RepID=UPI00339AAFE2
MNNLPADKTLPIHILSSCFKNTVATYKFYWFFSIIESIEKGNHIIDKQSLFARMVANAWYTVNYFNLSFGVQDQFQNAIKLIIEVEGLGIDEKKDKIVQKLVSSDVKETIKTLRHFDGEVPYRFLSPWFSSIKGNKQDIYKSSQLFANDCIYAVDEHSVIINPKWITYLTENSGILKAFCYWHLCLYVQKRNPNVPDIANKLFKPPHRNSLLKPRKEFWDIIIERTGPVKCIYTKNLLNINEYAIDHFVPFAFVSHDLIWNLIPADKSFNCSKSDKLPIFDKYFDDYFELQELAMKTVFSYSPRNKLLQNYLTILPDLSLLNTLSKEDLKDRFKDNILPLITIAANNGFEYLY